MVIVKRKKETVWVKKGHTKSEILFGDKDYIC